MPASYYILPPAVSALLSPPPATLPASSGFVFSPFVLPFEVIFVTALNSNTLRVFLTQEPKHISPLAPDDALNRLNWAISLTSGPGGAPVVEAVENPQAQPAVLVTNPEAWSIDLRVDRRVLLASVYLVVASSAITTANRLLTMAAPPLDRGSANGDMRPRARPRETPNAVTPGIDIFYETFQAAWQLDSGGDLAIHGGLSALKKRILRRMMSSPGGFYHLPTYGAGLRVKELRRTTNLREVERQIRTQVLEESEIVAVKVSATAPAPGVLVIRIDAKTVEGLPLGINLEIPDDGPVVTS